MASPALNAVPTSSVSSALTTVLPSPGASMSAAMVTMESAAMMVWFTPSTTVRFDSGSSTVASVWPRVAPRDCAASTVAAGTERIAWAVMRTAGGVAKISVAIVAEAGPMRKNSVSGAR